MRFNNPTNKSINQYLQCKEGVPQKLASGVAFSGSMKSSFKELESLFHCHVYPICYRGAVGKSKAALIVRGNRTSSSFLQCKAVSHDAPLVLKHEYSRKPLMESVEHHQ